MDNAFGRVCVFVCQSVCLFVRALKGKRLELSTPNVLHVYSIAVARHVLTQRSKGQRSRSHGYENRAILRVSCTAKKTNEWALNKAGVKSELLDTVKARKLAYYGHTMRKQGSCLVKEIMQRTMPGARRRGRPHMAWMDNINTWTGLSVEESIRTR